MKNTMVVAVSVACVALGMGIGYAAKEKAPGIDVMRGKSAKEASQAALDEAEKLAGKGTWELLGVARVYYLSGDKARGQSLIDRVMSYKTKGNDWQRIGQIYADAGENDKAAVYFQKVLDADPNDDTGQAEIGSWYIRIGQRDKGEALLGRALSKSPEEVWHYVRIAEALNNLQPR